MTSFLAAAGGDGAHLDTPTGSGAVVPAAGVPATVPVAEGDAERAARRDNRRRDAHATTVVLLRCARGDGRNRLVSSNDNGIVALVIVIANTRWTPFPNGFRW